MVQTPKSLGRVKMLYIIMSIYSVEKSTGKGPVALYEWHIHHEVSLQDSHYSFVIVYDRDWSAL